MPYPISQRSIRLNHSNRETFHANYPKLLARLHSGTLHRYTRTGSTKIRGANVFDTWSTQLFYLAFSTDTRVCSPHNLIQSEKKPFYKSEQEANLEKYFVKSSDKMHAVPNSHEMLLA